MTQNKSVLIWLSLMIVLVLTMIGVGAVTRLTESGLSMVTWRAFIDVLPPLSPQAWQSEFDLYKQTPEFLQKNAWMDVDDFKRIYFWEWFHRLLGRLLGVVYALPFLFFLVRGKIPPVVKPLLWVLLALGGLQGALGWYMVKSGLIDVPAVSHYRLAAHLGMAFLILSLLLWAVLSLIRPAQISLPALKAHIIAALGLLALTMLWGAFTAGLDAGLIYNDTFPLMGGRIMPPDLWYLSPLWLNFLENHAGVQFLHRWLGIGSFVMIISLYMQAWRNNYRAPEIKALPFMVTLQAGLGIATLLSHVWLPLATAHQLGAAVLLMLLVTALYRLSPPRP